MVVDFVIDDVQTAWQFQTVDEILTPVVKQLGGDEKHVKLVDACSDPTVRNFFQNGMKCEWDFDDFASYFHGHYETWDYDATQRLLRLRKPGEIDLEARAKASKQPPTKRSKPTVSKTPPTKVLVLANLVGAGEVDSDLEEETAEEASKSGKLNKCVIKEMKGVPDEEAVRIFLEFEAVDSASKAFDVFNGRIFDGRSVKAWFYDESVFKDGDLEK